MGIVNYIESCNGYYTHQNINDIVSHYIMLKKGINIEFPDVLPVHYLDMFNTMFIHALKYFC